jgi:tripartite-type tricarboxylate transporter receptor subunit TctC
MQASASEGEQAMMRRILGWIVAWTALAFSGSVLGESYPSRPVTLIVPYAAGGGVDAVARVITESLSERLGQRFVIENVTGAGGVIGTQRAARAQPDGYTLLFAVENTMAVAKLVQPTVVQYDSQKDFQPISLIGTAPLVLAGKKDLPANNIAELMTLLKANPGKYSFASSGVGTSLHVLGEMINVEGKVKMVHVPYRAAANRNRSDQQPDRSGHPPAESRPAILPQWFREDLRRQRAHAFTARPGLAEPGRAPGPQRGKHDRLVRLVRARQH